MTRRLVPELEARRHLIEDHADFTQIPEAVVARWKAPFGPPEDWDLTVVDQVVPGPHGPVPVRVYTPVGTPPAGGRACLVWMHGGAFSWGDLEMAEAHEVARGVAGRADAVVVSVDYRLCPVMPELGGTVGDRVDERGEPVRFPVPQDDCLAVLDAVRADPARFGVDAARVAIGGASAGAFLAAAATLRSVEDGRAPWQTLLVYPMLHPRVPALEAELAEAVEAAPRALQFPAWMIEATNRTALGREPEPSDVEAFPGLAARLEGFPPTYVENGELDAFRASGELFSTRLRAAGVDVVEVTRAGVPHGHLDWVGFGPAHDTLDALAQRLGAPAGAKALDELRVDGAPPSDVPLHHVWNRCVGAGRANEALRADWQAHFREAVDVLGVRSVRFHGLFHDDMFVYRATYGGGFAPPEVLPEPQITFSYVDMVVDAILDAGARPFVELGFMPRELATQTETLFWWKAHCSPPTDMAEWVRLVSETVRHWIERYGLDEVREWRFEVWNEPNLVPHFWTGTRTEYFELYEATARALKAIDPQLKVGGPSTSVFVPDARYAGETYDRAAEFATGQAPDPDALDWQPVWVRELVEWCAERDLPLDFLSTHLYPTDYAADVTGSGFRAIHRHVDATEQDLRLLRELIAASPYPDAELHITEWSSSPSSRDRTHDTLFAATYITRAFLKGAALADSISYWTFTDIFEEGGAGLGPFHGGFGFVNEQGIHKPTFHAVAMLNRLGDRVVHQDDQGIITRSSSDGRVSAVFLHYPAAMGTRGVEQHDSYAATRAYREIGTARRVRHSVAGVEPGTVFQVELLDWEHGNAAEAWHQMGEPLNLTRAQTATLKAVADDLRRWTVTVPESGVLELDLELPAWAVASVAQDDPAAAVGAR